MRPLHAPALLTFLILSLAAWTPSLAQTPPADQAPPGQQDDPNEAERRGLTSPEVEKSQMPQPTQQGNRPPPSDTNSPGAVPQLYEALTAVWNSPAALDGQRIARPNPLASQPESEMQPHPAGDPDSLFPEGYIE